MRTYQEKIKTWDEIGSLCNALREQGKLISFTNGSFDLLHLGHIDYLTWARQQGDLLIVGMNNDASVRRYKGEQRPIVPEQERASVLAALECVDYVVLFEQDEPVDLISVVRPDVLVKGEDWAHYVAGRDIVEAYGGRVALAKFVEGKSTTNIIEKIRSLS